MLEWNDETQRLLETDMHAQFIFTYDLFNSTWTGFCLMMSCIPAQLVMKPLQNEFWTICPSRPGRFEKQWLDHSAKM